MNDWKIFQGNGETNSNAIERLPAPPRWRRFNSKRTGSATNKERLGGSAEKHRLFVGEEPLPANSYIVLTWLLSRNSDNLLRNARNYQYMKR